MNGQKNQFAKMNCLTLVCDRPMRIADRFICRVAALARTTESKQALAKNEKRENVISFRGMRLGERKMCVCVCVCVKERESGYLAVRIKKV